MPEPAFLPVSGDRIERPQSTYEDVCDTRLWMMDLEGDCRRVIEAMPAARRARFSLVKIVSWETVIGPDADEEQKERPVVYFLTTRRLADGKTWYCSIPFAEAMLKDEGYTAETAEMLLSRAEQWFEMKEQRAL
jgi:hypothetical protein